ncbi:Uncharacterised protein [Providencia rustigianii]|nr:Uncharacterised protein [Providencia rustigianii]
MGNWCHAGTGWLAYPELLSGSLAISDSQITLPDAQDMLPIARQLWLAGKVTAVENVETHLSAQRSYVEKITRTGIISFP